MPAPQHPIPWHSRSEPPFVFEAVSSSAPAAGGLADRVMIDVIHEGANIPAEFLRTPGGRRIPEGRFYGSYILERDWGATIVARRIAERLGLDGFYRVTTARCLLDFGRFPGITQPGAGHLRRFAINHPFSSWLGFDQCKKLLEEHYDVISDGMDRAIEGKVLKLAVHTYDRYNANGTERPHVSLISRALGLQENHELPYGVFDPLYPDIISEFTVDRVLRDRISLTLEKSGVPVAHNYPYLLPEGSPEVRHQVWSFFHWLQARFEAAHPESVGAPGYERVWRTLKDTNLRSAEAGALRSYLRLFRRPATDDITAFSEAERAYRTIERFVHEGGDAIVRAYRYDPGRAMSLGVEVRKDLVWRFDEAGHPEEPDAERALFVADRIADAVLLYFGEDRPTVERLRAEGGPFERGDTWGVKPGSPTFGA